MKKNKLFCKCPALILIVCASIYLASCSSTPSAGKKDSHLSPSATKDYEKTSITDSEYYHAEIRYPVFADLAIVNDKIEKIITEKFELFDKNAESSWQELNSERKSSGASDETPPFELTIKCEPVTNNKNYISVIINIYTYEGGAHGYTNLVSVNYDKAQKKFISLPDIDGWSYERASEISRADLRKQFGADAGSVWIDEGTSPTAENFSVFTYDGITLTIYFEQYQVAPYAYGIQAVTTKI